MKVEAVKQGHEGVRGQAPPGAVGRGALQLGEAGICTSSGEQRRAGGRSGALKSKGGVSECVCVSGDVGDD